METPQCAHGEEMVPAICTAGTIVSAEWVCPHFGAEDDCLVVEQRFEEAEE